MSERTYHAALTILGPASIAHTTSVACESLIVQLDHLAVFGAPDSAADLAETIGVLEVQLQQLRLIAGPALVDLGRVEHLARLQSLLRKAS